MLSINENVVSEIYIKRSRFITFLFRVDSINDIEEKLLFLSNKYNDSTHICYAYILGGIKKVSDDGEPSGTAGMPILNVLDSKKLDHILCCIVRYFGGIKLGANGLIRAYSNCTSSAIALTNIIQLIPGKLCRISFEYCDTKSIDVLLNDCIIVDKSYDLLVTYNFKISLDLFDSLIDEFKRYNFVVISDCYVEQR